MAPDFAAIPLIDSHQAQEIYSLSDDEDVADMQAEIWRGIWHDLPAELRALAPGPGLPAELHRIRGYAATAGLSRLAAILEHWEMSADPDALMDRVEPALAACAASVAAIEAEFPHLVNSPTG